ncbi:hypothetical protein LTR56_004994 [Elasticomyces elasticus]|nr:hypothetical protein LTR22_015809 [Elasticomyces elasticus]KAK3652700.1 hypothetical protein LTR56_004994 [Elasticomyces elasticus]KAK4914630.1 hypothetical protein LTR49_017197 [Elasticomyces elasticus]KAK5753996.1 hypothetical protein LTS12_015962 [Elasticomyces elasticus]
MLFPNQVRNHQNGNDQIRGADAFTIVVTEAPPTFQTLHLDLYCATIAYHDGCFKHAANGTCKSSTVEALQSLLDTTALALAADMARYMVSERDVERLEHGGGLVMGGRVTPGRSQANATILFADQVNVHPARLIENFTIAVTKIGSPEETGLYCAHFAYYQEGVFNDAASGGMKKSVLEALQSLLDTLAVGLAARRAEKMSGHRAWVVHGEGKILEGYIGDFDDHR